MSIEQWTAVDQFITGHLLPPDPALEAVQSACAAAGLPAISVTPPQGRFLYLLARMQGARRILEVGTLGGYSTVWLARALPHDGRLITLEVDPRHAELARQNIEQARFKERVDVHLGPALQTLPQLTGPFDLIFIDADKENTAAYFQWALRLSRRGTIIVVDNVVRKGAVIDATSADASVQGIRKFYEAAAAEKRVEATALQTVGGKGYDGFALVRVTEAPK
jgi:predicted O-methyltransferase YrrM